MFSEEEQSRIIRDFKSLNVNTELSYETWIHKKVYDANCVIAIPEGKKAFAWFTQYKKQNVCFILETFKKEITSVKPILTAFHERMAYGSIFYGTTFYYNHSPLFCIENVLQYKSKTIARMTQSEEKIKIYKEIFSVPYLKQETCMKNQVIFGLPLMSGTLEQLMQQMTCVPYKIKYIQYQYPEKKCNLDYNELQQMVHGTNRVQIPNHKFEKSYQNFVDPNKEVVFRVTADITNDIYNLFVYNPQENDKFEFIDVAYIPDYKTSVFMNEYFRKIKENKNLDALEESDDEEEFQDDRPDKFVFLDKKYNMVCKYNNKFRRWAPCSLARRGERVITKMELDRLNREGQEQNLRYSQNRENKSQNYNQNYKNQKYQNYNKNHKNEKYQSYNKKILV